MKVILSNKIRFPNLGAFGLSKEAGTSFSSLRQTKYVTNMIMATEMTNVCKQIVTSKMTFVAAPTSNIMVR